MTRAEVLVVGEALIDIVHRADGTADEVPGGSPANVAIALGRLGRAPRLLTRLGDDERGRRIARWLEESGVAVAAAPSGRTSTATATLGLDGGASYDFAIEWDVDAAAAGAPDVLHVGSIATLLEPGADAVSALVDRLHGAALVTYDPNIRPSLVAEPEEARRRVAELVSRADVVKASDEDVAWLHPGEDPEAVARRWASSGPALVVVTAGAEGAIAAAGERVLRTASVRTDVVDTVGAGDTFMGALIDGLIEARAAGRDARRAIESLDDDALVAVLARCARAAAITVSRPGADPPRRAELDPGLSGDTTAPARV
jgi:fructokinase